MMYILIFVFTVFFNVCYACGLNRLIILYLLVKQFVTNCICFVNSKYFIHNIYLVSLLNPLTPWWGGGGGHRSLRKSLIVSIKAGVNMNLSEI